MNLRKINPLLFISLLMSLPLQAVSDSDLFFQGQKLTAQMSPKIALNLGDQVRSPLVVPKFRMVSVIGTGIPTTDLLNDLKNNDLKPVLVKGEQVIEVKKQEPVTMQLQFLQFHEIYPAVGLDPYSETILVVATLPNSFKGSPRADDVHYFIWDIKVSNDKAIRAGREIMGVPKSGGVTGINLTGNGDYSMHVTGGDDYHAAFITMKCSGCQNDLGKDRRPYILSQLEKETKQVTAKRTQHGDQDLPKTTSFLTVKSYCPSAKIIPFDESKGDIKPVGVKGASSAIMDKIKSSLFTPLTWMIVPATDNTQGTCELILEKNQ